MSIKGKKDADISAANGNIEITKIKNAGYEFVMIKCGLGSDIASQDDKQFENNVKKCEAAGLPWGVYLYSYALNTTDAKSEAQHVLLLLKGKNRPCPSHLTWRTQTVIRLKTVCRQTQRLLTYVRRF